MDSRVFEIVECIHNAIDEYQVRSNCIVGLDALGALGYFAGVVISEAPDSETRMQAHKQFLQLLNDGLNHKETRKH